MKLVCERAALVETLALMRGVIPTRSPKPVLQCVRIEASAEEGTLSLSGTDLDVGLQLATDKVQVESGGVACIPADKVDQIVRESSDSTLTIEVENDEARIRGADARFTVYGYPPAEYPNIEDVVADEPDFTVDAAELRRLVDRTLFATARENSRYAINGVLLSRRGNRLQLVSTDSRRLALARGSCQSAGEGGDEDESTCIIPTKALRLLIKLLGTPEEDERIAVRVGDRRIAFVIGEDGERSVLSSNLVEGSFPPYEDVIPTDLDVKLDFDVDTLASAVRRAALLTNEESKGVRMTFGPGELVITSRAPELGEAEVRLPLPDYQGEPLQIGFNPSFITDALNVVEDDRVHLELKAANTPGMIKSGNDFVYVLMPVSLG